MDGRTSDHPGQRDVRAYGLGGRMLRELHDLTAGSVLAGERECVTHGDPGPFNTIFRAGLPVALIDWDSCRPGGRLDDLAYMAWTWGVQALGNVPVGEQAEHVRLVREGYGGVEPEVLVDAMLARQSGLAEVEAANARDQRLDTARRRHAVRAVEWARNDRAVLERHRDAFLR
ncbi:phosphotransferase [Actinoplanes sp. NPDC049596]|uniref:phosphotransferase n=1 Tax=unclassified Actinoplanes TaxID=2626549 RepID=UPI003426CC77